MTATELLQHLRYAGVELWADGERLRYDAPDHALSEELLARLRVHKPEILELVRARGMQRLLLSPAQEGFWLLDALYPGFPGANEQFAIWLDGPLDVAALDVAWQRVMARHAILNARFGETDGVAWQQLDEPAAAALPRLALASHEALLAYAATAITTPFDLRAGALLRPVLAQLGQAAHVLLVTVHHIVADGLSVAIIRDDLARYYAALRRGQDLPAEPAAPQYAEWVLAQHSGWSPQRSAPQLRWWREQLHGAPPRHALPRRACATAGPGGARRLAFAVEPALASRLRALAREQGVSLFTLLLAALRVLLARYSGQDDILISSPVTWRDDARRRRMVGCLVNNAVFRTSTAGEPSFIELLARERATLLGVLEHREAPFGQVVEALQVDRRAGEQPLSQILFQFDVAPPVRAAADVGFRIEPVHADRCSYWDLEWSVTDRGEALGLGGHLCYARAGFEDWLLETVPARFITLLASIANAPASRVTALPLLGAGELRQVLVEWNHTRHEYPAAATLHGLVAQRLRREPDAVALRTEHGDWTAARLDSQVMVLAAQLQALGAGPGERVALSLRPSAHLVVGLLAILRTGAAFVPLDPAYPGARREFMLRDSQARWLVTEREGVEFVGAAGVTRIELDGFDWQAGAGEPVAVPDDPDSAACVLYTSGSTGEPKGAINMHRGAVNRCHWMWQAYGFGADDVFCLRTSINFVDSLWEIFGALMHGIPLAILAGEAARDPALLVPALARHGVTQLVLVPPLLRALLETSPQLAQRLGHLRTIITSGEPLPPDLWESARRVLPAVRVINTYGTSEIWDASAFDTSTA